MAVSTVVAVTAAASYESNRKARSAQKRSERRQEAEMKRQRAEDKKAEEKQRKLEEAATPFSGTGAQARIGAERMYLRRSRRGGRMSTIKSKGANLG